MPFRPDPFQVRAVHAIKRSDCLVTAPTGAGKTWIALETISSLFKTGGRSWYASPLKALSNSKYLEFSEYFGQQNVGILTGDRKENTDAPIIVGTTEILRNQLYDAMHRGESLASDFIVLDEAHFLGDEDRGVVWEEVMIYLPARIPILMLSATIGNAKEIAGWLASIRRKKCAVIEERRRPVPLFPLFFHPSGALFPLLSDAGQKGKKKLSKKAAEYAANPTPPVFSAPHQIPPFGEMLRVLKKYHLLPAIFFLKSRHDCDLALERCTKNAVEDPDRKERLMKRIAELAGQSPHISGHRQLRWAEEYAVGSHHGGQLPAWKIVIERLMTEGLLDAVFATSTVAAGVNFPARTVLFLNSDRFNGTEFLPMNPTEFHQMTGRAGRRGMDNIGFAAAIPGKFMNLKLIAELFGSEPTDVRSQIKINFSMVLNLLLSHTPDQVEELLEKSFAKFQMVREKGVSEAAARFHLPDYYLKMDFNRHLGFLKQNGFVTETGELTEDGIWTSQLRVDQPLLIAQGLRTGLFPETDPAMLAAMISIFVYDGEAEGNFDRQAVPKTLREIFARLAESLSPFSKSMIKKGFKAPNLLLTPAVAVYLWAVDTPWESVRSKSGLAEGDLAMLILRTVDNLRHVVSLQKVFPQTARSAGNAVSMLLRDPIYVEELLPLTLD
ncbi:MAG: DEAD/DEAH box helicase [Thermodesulfobacteriota bacterium]